MIKSMTGYGGAKGEVEGLRVSVEVRSVNNRYLDVTTKMPRSFIFAEDAVKQAVQSHISRGKVDVFVSVDASGSDDTAVTVNEPLLDGYIKALNSIAEQHGLKNDLSLMSLARLPDVLTLERRDMDAESVCAGLLGLLETALTEYDAMRTREGEKLREDVAGRLKTISELTGIVEKNAPLTVDAYRARLEAKLREVLEDKSIDSQRIVQEAAIFADRIAVDEETVRLRSHLSQMDGMLKSTAPVGRKMDFLIQEMNRETNTIGSKCQSSDIAYVVVDMKAEIEKIREQIQNVE